MVIFMSFYGWNIGACCHGDGFGQPYFQLGTMPSASII